MNNKEEEKSVLERDVYGWKRQIWMKKVNMSEENEYK